MFMQVLVSSDEQFIFIGSSVDGTELPIQIMQPISFDSLTEAKCKLLELHESNLHK
jgi:hypothetical protein